MFSPHANLHLKAVDLAIEHTTYFFDQIRSQIGDREFSKFLNLEVCEGDLIGNATLKLADFTNEKVDASLKEAWSQNFTTKFFKP